MSVDILEYKKVKEELKNLKHTIYVLDDVADVLYNNLSDSGIWELLQKLEDIRFEKYLHFDVLTCQLAIIGEKNGK